ncbi:MAG: SDR family NAD(P)-dependent oxidoreductase [Desulfobacterales bacterium]|jgi:NAD(P)-dependent dehydrogenase (short-subunit alcohol dehydrogenase family)
MNSSNSKVAIITGGASGIGRALCEELALTDTIVVAADINIEGAKQVAAQISGNGGSVRAEELDVTDAQAVKVLIDRVTAEYGRLDYIFNNAGITVGAEVRDMDLGHFRSVLDTNLYGVIYGTLYAYEVMVKQGFGHIVNTASLAGLLPFPIQVPYCATKFGVVGFSKSLRIEAAALGVRISVVCPGFVRTGIFEASRFLKINKQKIMEKMPLKMVEPDQAAQRILKGVRKNKAVIVFPFGARFFYWLYSFHPAFLVPIHRKMLADFRLLRETSK